jgi:hypothetical protein
VIYRASQRWPGGGWTEFAALDAKASQLTAAQGVGGQLELFYLGIDGENKLDRRVLPDIGRNSVAA